MNDYLAYRVKYSNELYHYGVKGQKWGIRRYQNPDGSLTDEGKKRYQKIEDDVKKAALIEEQGIAIANYGNLREGRAYNEDSPISRKVRLNAIANRKKIDKMIKELDDSGYFKQTYGKKMTFDDYKSSIEGQAYRRYIQKYGQIKVSDYDPDGSEDYENAIYDFTTAMLNTYK